MSFIAASEFVMHSTVLDETLFLDAWSSLGVRVDNVLSNSRWTETTPWLAHKRMARCRRHDANAGLSSIISAHP
jgi:hypothetical protein